MFDKLVFKEMLKENDEEFALFTPAEPREEVGFAINFASMGLPQPETNGKIRFVGDYE